MLLSFSEFTSRLSKEDVISLNVRKWAGNKTFAFVSLVALSFLAYQNSLHGALQADDYIWFQELKIFDLSVFELFTLTKLRFLGFMSFLPHYFIHDLNVVGYHLVSVALHTVNGYLVYLLGRRLTDQPVPSLMAALLFVCHPIHTQAVNSIIQRMTLLVACFYLLALLSYIHFRTFEQWKSLACFVLCSFAAFFTKENSFTLPLAIIAIEGVYFKGKLLRVIGVSVVFYALAAALALKLSLPLKGNTSMDVTTYLTFQVDAVRYYIEMLFNPNSLRSLYTKDGFGLYAIASFALHVFMLSTAYLSKRSSIIFGILFFYIALLVESSAFPIREAVAEHRAYLPSVGLFIAGSSFVYNFKHKGIVIAAVALLFLANQTRDQNQTWSTHVKHWENAEKFEPTSWLVKYNLGKAYELEGRINRSMLLYSESLKLKPNAPAYQAVGDFHFRNSNCNGAADAYLKAMGSDRLSLGAKEKIELLKKLVREGKMICR